MKKILCILIALACAFSIVSCSFGGTSDGGNSDGGLEIGNPLEDVVAASEPTKIVTKISYLFPDGDARFGLDLNGLYSLEIDDVNAKFTYDYKYFATPEEGAENWIKSISGTIYYRDGEILLADGEDWELISAAVVTRKFNLAKSYFKTYEKSADEKTLTATLTPSSVEGVLGYSLSTNGDVTVVITTDGVFMRGITISYTSLEGASVTIDTSYSYNDITVVFPTEG